MATSIVIDQLDAKLADLVALFSSNAVLGDPTILRQAKECSNEIKSICDEISPQSEAFQFFCSRILSPNVENSVLNLVQSYLRKSHQLIDIIGILLEALIEVFRKNDTDIFDHIQDFITLGLNVVRQDQLKAKREFGYIWLNNILETAAIKNHDINRSITEIVKFCQEQLETSGLKQIENSGVKNGLYQLMGKLCKHYPAQLIQSTRNYGHVFATVLSLDLKAQMSSKSKAPVYAVLEGCFWGFNGVLSNFPDVFEKVNRITLRQLYDYAKMVCDPSSDINRHGPKKAALTLLINHSHLFGEFFICEFELLYRYFSYWSIHSDREMRKCGLQASEVLLENISSQLPGMDEEKLSEAKIVYKYFMSTFENRFSGSTNIRELSLAAKGFGLFAQSTKNVMSERKLVEYFKMIYSRVNNIMESFADPIELKVTYFPTFLEAMSNILLQIDLLNSSDDLLGSLECLQIELFDKFSYIDKRYHNMCCKVMLKTFLAASKHNPAYSYQVVKQVLIHLISTPVPEIMNDEENQSKISNEKVFSIEDFSLLWILVLQEVFSSLAQDKTTLALVEMKAKLALNFFQIYFEILQQLDFEVESFYIQDDDESSKLHDKNTLIKKRNDFLMFVNMVEILRVIMPCLSQNSVSKSIKVALPILFELLERYPNIFGFYEILTSLFNECKLKKVPLYEDEISLGKISKMLKLVLEKINQFEEGVLISALKLILTFPDDVIKSQITTIACAIREALKIGLSNIEVAEYCLNALESWESNLVYNEFCGLYTRILDQLTNFLNSDQIQAVEMSQKAKSKRKKAKFQQIQPKNEVIYDKNKSQSAKIKNIQSRIYLLIGRMGGEANDSVFTFQNKDTVEESWPNTDLLGLNLALSQYKPSIIFDKFLPCLCHLSLTSSDKKTKMSSCESLHALILYALGKKAQANYDKNQKDDFLLLFKRLLTVVVKLCCDQNEVVKEMYRLLFCQIIHWFTTTGSNDESLMLMKILMTLVEEESHATLKNFAVESLDEFFKWAIKCEKSLEIVQTFMTQIFKMSTNKSDRKRLAACQIFNTICRSFREDNELIDKYLMKCIDCFFKCAKLSHYDHFSLESVRKTLSHLEKILTKKAENFTTGLNKNNSIDILIDFLFENIGSIETEFRHLCFDWLKSFAQFSKTHKSQLLMFEKYLEENGSSILIDKLEGKFNTDKNGIYYLDDSIIIDFVSEHDLIYWSNCILAVLDNYFVVISDSLIPTELIIGDSFLHSKLFYNLAKIFSYLNTVHKIDNGMSGEYSYNSLFVRWLQFTTNIFGRESLKLSEKCRKLLIDSNFLDLVFKALIEPEVFGFDVQLDKKSIDNLMTVLYHWFKAVREPLLIENDDLKGKFDTFFEELNSKFFTLIGSSNIYTMPKHQIEHLTRIVQALNLLKKCKLETRKSENNGIRIWNIIKLSCTQKSIHSDIDYQDLSTFIDPLLSLALNFNSEIDEIINDLLDNNLSIRQHYGKNIFKLFAIENYLAIFLESSVSKIDNIESSEPTLLEFLDFVASDTKMRQKSGPSIVYSVLKYFMDFWDGNSAKNLQYFWLNIVQKCAKISAKVFLEPSDLFESLHRHFCDLLVEKTTDMDFKVKLISLLGLFAQKPAFDEALRLCLEKFTLDNLPIKSTESSSGSLERQQYISAFRKIIFGFEISKNEVIFEILIKLICREPNHILSQEFRENVMQTSTNLTNAKFMTLISIGFDMFFNTENRYNADYRLNLLEKILLPMLNGAKVEVLKMLFLGKLKEMTEILKVPFQKVYKKELILKLGCLKMLEIMYSSLPVETLKGQMNECFLGKVSNEKTELIKFLMKILLEARKEGLPFDKSEDELSIDLKWKYRCSAHNCLIAIISATQSKSHIFEGSIFKDIWDLIAHPNKAYIFDVDYIKLPAIKTGTLNLKRVNFGAKKTNKNQTRINFDSQSILNQSSLQSALQNYDFTTILSTVPEIPNDKNGNETENLDSQMEIDSVSEMKHSSLDVFDLEADDLNLHPSMQSILVVLKLMEEKNIANMEALAQVLVKTLESKLASFNSKLLIARVIVLRDHQFSCVANHLITPLIDLFLNDKLGPNGINNFRLDLLITLLGWAQHTKPKVDQKSICSRLLVYIVKNCQHENHEVTRRNLQLLNYMLGVWPEENFAIDPEITWDFLDLSISLKSYIDLRSVDALDKRLTTTLQILSSFYMNNIDGMADADYDDVIRDRLIDFLFECINHQYLRVAKGAAECFGSVVKFYKQKFPMNVQTLVEKLETHLISLLGKNTIDDQNRFLQFLISLQRKLPGILNSNTSHILTLLPNCHGDQKLNCLEIVYNNLSNLTNSVVELKSRGLESLLRIRSTERQKLALKILLKLLQYANQDDVQEFSHWIIDFVNHPDLECRTLLRDISFWCFDKFKDENQDIGDEYRKILIRLLDDNDNNLKTSILAFFCDQCRFTDCTVQRLYNVVQKLYVPEVPDSNFLANANFILMELTSKSPDFKKPLFEKPLKDCVFTDLKLQSRTFGPKSIKNFPSSLLNSGSQNPRCFVPVVQIKATLPVNMMAFTPTLANTSQTGTLSFENTFEENASINRSMSSSVVNIDIDDSETNKIPINNELKWLKRRILKDKGKTSQIYAQAAQRKSRKMEKSSETVSGVTVYRSYRDGDYPDIQQPLHGLLGPMQALAQYDLNFAGLLFESLAVGVFEEFLNDKSMEEKIEEIIDRFIGPIKSILENNRNGPSRQLVLPILNLCFEFSDRFQIPAKLVCDSCLYTGLSQMGCILLEKYISQLSKNVNSLNHHPPLKRAKVTTQGNDDFEKSIIYVELCRLYKALNEQEKVRVILTQHLQAKSSTKLAWDYESDGDFYSAFENYSLILNGPFFYDKEYNEVEKSEISYCEESRLRCLQHMNDWTSLVDLTSEALSNDLSNVWSTDYVMSMFMSPMVTSHLLILLKLEKSTENSTLVNFIRESYGSPEKRGFLESHLTLQMAILHAFTTDYEKAMLLCDKAIRRGIKCWTAASANNLDSQGKSDLIVSALMTSDYCCFDQARKETNYENLQKLAKRFSQSCPNVKFSPVDIWDTVIRFRKFYLDRLNSKFEKELGPFSSDNKRIVQKCVIDMKLKFIDSCLQHSNFTVAFEELESIEKIPDLNRLSIDLKTGFLAKYTQVQFEYIKRNGSDLLDNIYRLCKVVSFTENCPETGSNILLARAMSEIGFLIHKPDYDQIEEVLNKVSQQLKVGDSGKITSDMIFDRALQLFKSNISDSRSHLIKFCDKILKIDEIKESQKIQYAECLAENLLINMANGDFESHNFFPRLLILLEKFPNVAEKFTENAKMVPSWMFLAWLDQLIAYQNVPTGKFLRPILERIAECYPQALLFPLSVWLSMKQRNCDSDVLTFFQTLSSKIDVWQDGLQFIENLQLICDVGILLNNAYRILNLRSLQRENFEELSRQILEIFALSSYTCCGLGWSCLQQKYETEFKTIMGKNFYKKLTNSDLDELKILVKKALDFTKSKKNLFTTLKDYSKWMFEYSAESKLKKLHVPGQYNGKCKPDLANNSVYIESFDQKVKFFDSMRRPRSLSILGSDGRLYTFVVKCGEDLRQDRRVQQIFHQMNEALHSNMYCRSKRIQIETYDVIPVTTEIGLIEFVDDVVSLTEFAAQTLLEKTKSLQRVSEDIITILAEMGLYGKEAKNTMKISPNDYIESYLEQDCKQAVKMFDKIHEKSMPYLLKKSLISIASSPEAWFTLRQNFVGSYSALCASGYMLGIGDRHLGNILINNRSARVIGIDFGCVFGTATQFLKVPELAPIRMTSQIVNVTSPVGWRAFYLPQMANCFLAFRQSSHLLMNTMDVFVKEPTLNWILEAKRQAQFLNSDNSSSDFEWYPKQKMDIVAKKFQGLHPALIIQSELESVHGSNTEFPLQQIKQALNQCDDQNNIDPNLNLSAERQAEALIKLASSSFTLSRMYIGWEPWF